MTEIKRITRTLTHEGVDHNLHDLVLCYNLEGYRPWGFAIMLAKEQEKNTDICFSLTDQEFEQFWKAKEQTNG